ncbi:unnamed protein product [Lactuca virosa]|uniref:Uncharacterized protein n=1 Tax=Lactuca virosa TaxID=75947 RepID=A0AAU9LKY8_9ASTR|nr:unnamed protein product [Lactuca virosa]
MVTTSSTGTMLRQENRDERDVTASERESNRSPHDHSIELELSPSPAMRVVAVMRRQEEGGERVSIETVTTTATQPTVAPSLTEAAQRRLKVRTRQHPKVAFYPRQSRHTLLQRRRYHRLSSLVGKMRGRGVGGDRK